MEKEVEIEHRLTAVEAKASSNTKRLDTVEDNQKILTDLVTGVTVLGTKMEQANDNISNLTTKVEEIERKPAKRYEELAGAVIAAIVMAVVGYFLGRLGL